MIGQLIKEGVTKTSDFSWQAQLRYYWENNDSWVRMINATLNYNYEYLGNSSRLVITPLTDRCYRTLCGALNLELWWSSLRPCWYRKNINCKRFSKSFSSSMCGIQLFRWS
jgi:dynein heavy chain